MHVDKKWWFMTEQDYKRYLTVRETPPKSSISNKNNIVKVMMLSALARPWFNVQGVCTFNSKIGIWAFVDTHKAKRTTKLHNKDDKYLVPKPKITQNVYQNMLIQKVLPAICRVFPQNNRNVVIQQDGAKVHTSGKSMKWLKAQGICVMEWPPQSPDLNPIEHL